LIVADCAQLSPFHGHATTAALATEVFVYQIGFSIESLDDVEAPYYKAPRRLIVCRADGGALTISDVVEQLSPYLNDHKDNILEAKAPLLQINPTVSSYEDILGDIKSFFTGFSPGVIETSYYSIGVGILAKEVTQRHSEPVQ
jgi:hypothetical protein